MIEVIIGPTASGKTTYQEKLINEGWKKIITTTSRTPRYAEVNGVDYHFVHASYFENEELFVEINNYAGNLYGLEKSAISNIQEGEKYCIVVDLNGFHKFSEYCNKNNIKYQVKIIETDLEVCIERLLDRMNTELANRDIQHIPVVSKLSVLETFVARIKQLLVEHEQFNTLGKAYHE